MNQHEPIFFTVPSGDTKRARILHKGGGGGDGGAADREEERQARIAEGTRKINEIFGIAGEKTSVPTGQRNITGYTRQLQGQATTDGNGNAATLAPTTEHLTPAEYAARQKQAAPNSQQEWSILGGMQSNPNSFDASSYKPIYQDVMKTVESPASLAAQQRAAMYDTTRNDTRQFFSGQLSEDSEKAKREMGFQKARQGIIGSSQSNDLDTDFQKRYDRGLLDVANRADGAANSFRTADEAARLSLISKVVSGLDTGTAAQNALSTLQTNQAAAKSDYQAQRMGNVFSDLLGGYNQQQYNNGIAAGKTGSTNQYGNWFSNDKAVTGEIT